MKERDLKNKKQKIKEKEEEEEERKRGKSYIYRAIMFRIKLTTTRHQFMGTKTSH